MMTEPLTAADASNQTALWFSRLVLWAGLVAIPAFGVLRVASGVPEPPLEQAVRAVIALSATAILWRGAQPNGDAWIRRGSFVMAFVVQGWFQCVGPWDARAGTSILVTSVATMSFTRPSEMVALWAFTVAATLVGAQVNPVGGQVAASIGSHTVVSLVVGIAAWYMRGLESALLAQGAILEQRVQERTAALRVAVERLEVEVSERRVAEQAALRSNLSKSVFLANMSHELRTPLNAILGYTEILLEDHPDDQRDLGRIQD